MAGIVRGPVCPRARGRSSLTRAAISRAAPSAWTGRWGDFGPPGPRPGLQGRSHPSVGHPESRVMLRRVALRVHSSRSNTSPRRIFHKRSSSRLHEIFIPAG